MKLNTWNNKKAVTWQVASFTIIPFEIMEKIKNNEIKPIDSTKGVLAEIDGVEIKAGFWIVLEDDKIKVISDKDFTKNYTQDTLEVL